MYVCGGGGTTILTIGGVTSEGAGGLGRRQ